MDHHVSPAARYTHNMMQIPSPKFVTLPIDEPNLQQLTSKSCKVVETMYDQSIKPLPETGQPKDGDRNFFAQGFLTGFVVLALPLLAGTVGVTTYIARKAYSSWRWIYALLGCECLRRIVIENICNLLTDSLRIASMLIVEVCQNESAVALIKESIVLLRTTAKLCFRRSGKWVTLLPRSAQLSYNVQYT